jgi:hypothetical protein
MPASIGAGRIHHFSNPKLPISSFHQTQINFKEINMKNVPLDNLRRQKISNRTADIPKKYRKIYKQAVETNNKSAAIKAFCLECVGWQKKEVINCSCLACPLFGLRPFMESRQLLKKNTNCN